MGRQASVRGQLAGAGSLLPPQVPESKLRLSKLVQQASHPLPSPEAG